MGENKIPSFKLCKEVLGEERESEEWKGMMKKVREACETHGFFVVESEKIPIEVQEELFETTKDMFDLPEETKLQYKKPTPKDGGYVVSNPFIPLYESFGVYGDDEVRAFEKLMWPHGKPGFCEIQNSINAKMLELNLLLLRMIFDSYGLGAYYDSKALDSNIVGRLRAHKYKIPKENQDPIGLKPHIDKTVFTILCQDSVQGLEVLSKDGKWFPIDIPRGALVVIVGDALEAWSNGRLHPVKHRVVMGRGQERYSCGFFSLPKDGVSVEVPQELVDKENPLRYRPFVYSEYLAKHLTNVSFDALQVYAGIE